MAKPTAEQVKKELFYATQDGFSEELGFKLLDDDTLCAQSYNDEGEVDSTFIVNVSIGRELKPEEWQEP